MACWYVQFSGDSHRYVPQALWQVTEHCEGVIVLHADRDSDCIALYAKEEFDWTQKLSELPTIEQELPFWFLVRDLMTLRWKRALYEACDSWDGDCPEELRMLVPLQEIDSVDDIEADDDVSIDEVEIFETESKEESSEDGDKETSWWS